MDAHTDMVINLIFPIKKSMLKLLYNKHVTFK